MRRETTGSSEISMLNWLFLGEASQGTSAERKAPRGWTAACVGEGREVGTTNAAVMGAWLIGVERLCWQVEGSLCPLAVLRSTISIQESQKHWVEA